MLDTEEWQAFLLWYKADKTIPSLNVDKRFSHKLNVIVLYSGPLNGHW